MTYSKNNYFDKVLATYTGEENVSTLLTSLYGKVQEVDPHNHKRFMPLLLPLLKSDDCQSESPLIEISLGNKLNEKHLLITYPITKARAIEIEEKIQRFKSLNPYDFGEIDEFRQLRKGMCLIEFMERYKIRYEREATINFQELDDGIILLEIYIKI